MRFGDLSKGFFVVMRLIMHKSKGPPCREEFLSEEGKTVLGGVEIVDGRECGNKVGSSLRLDVVAAFGVDSARAPDDADSAGAAGASAVAGSGPATATTVGSAIDSAPASIALR